MAGDEADPVSTRKQSASDRKGIEQWGNVLFLVALVPLLMQVGMLIWFNVVPLQPFASSPSNPIPQDESRAAQFSNPSPKLPGAESSGVDDCVISFADIHGDLPQAKAALALAGVVNDTHLWAAGECTFIQTGDLVDRGPDSLAVVQLFEDVKHAAEAGGGRFVGLLGNHELMNLQGDFRYVARSELVEIGRKAKERQTLQELLTVIPVGYRQGVMVYRGSPAFSGAAAWAGLMASGGSLGDAIRSKQVATVAGTGTCRTLFVHAGMLPAMLRATASYGGSRTDDLVVRFNDALTAIVKVCDGSAPCPPPSTPREVGDMIYVDGPFWTRDVSLGPEHTICPKVEAVLATAGAERMVVGHTIQERPETRCGGRVVLMDVGMCSDINGGLAVFKCSDGHMSIVQG